MLFDEATSALDRKNEEEIQATINKVSEGRTTIIIAHRLTTIIKSDIIFYIDKGQVAEKGTHQELLQIPNGKYVALTRRQVILEEKLHDSESNSQI